MSIKQRLLLIILLMSFLLLGLGGYGLVNLHRSNQALKTVYEDRVVALGKLDAAARSMLRTQWYLSLAGIQDADPSTQADELLATMKRSTEMWQQYTATKLTEQEQQLVRKTQAAINSLTAEIYEPGVNAVRAGDAARIKALAARSKQDYETLRVPLNDLVKLQLDVAEHEFTEGQHRYNNTLWLSIAAMVIGLSSTAVLGTWLIRSISAPLNYAVEVAHAVAKGDLTRRIDATSQDEVGQLLGALRAMNEGLLGIVAKVRGGSDLISTASGEIATGNLDLSSRTEQQASALEETASSLEELTSTVKQSADSANHASEMAARAASAAAQGGQEVQNVVAHMGSIKGSSTKIVEIIAVIDGIAFQTNILALNAAVEAARAGEQGRGFAVVASEVRTLAQRSAAAAKEIKALITDSVERINEGSALVEGAGNTMQNVVASITNVRDLIGEISAASREQTVGIEQINEAVMQMDSVTQQNAALVEQAAAAAQSLEEQAATLMVTVGTFKLPGTAPRALRQLT
ncbi:MCP four helix bundle domain-containing protein [Duganella sp. sic0402]|uniref:methyl-accepting chemotaxis protein n=1 Tax=Duganella sp. sic0402 TaxID=2854786 RepID=UPI001C45A166|nr:methyl-accepting chemotaxis protein [Duganella sp. sic0402]MBV7538375.1 MCP four helix bundle domain-containing protein [Duganella sp. sic0402]